MARKATPGDLRPLEELDRSELLEVLREMASDALDLAQHLELSARFLRRRRLRKAMVEAAALAHRLSALPHEGLRRGPTVFRSMSADRRNVRIERVREDSLEERLTPQPQAGPGPGERGVAKPTETRLRGHAPPT